MVWVINGLVLKVMNKFNISDKNLFYFIQLLSIITTLVICRKVSTAAFADRVLPYQFPIFDMGLFVLVLFVLEFVLSTWSIRKYRQQSLIEQMQSRE